MREQCGENAAIFMRDHLPRITNPVLEHHCSAYTYGPGTCDEALYRRRIVDGQLVVLQSQYHNHNPYYDQSLSSINNYNPSSQHLGTEQQTNGGDVNRIVRNQMSNQQQNNLSVGDQPSTTIIAISIILFSFLSILEFNVIL